MRCALCRNETELRNSHIYPEFLYETLYDPIHRLQLLTIEPDQRNKYKQNGFKEKLLCDSCEQKLSVWEGYASKVLQGGVPLRTKTEGSKIWIEGVDYAPFKLFMLSVLWRASVSTQNFFKCVELGPHEEILRGHLLRADPGKHSDYPCFMFGMKYRNDARADLMIQPQKTKLQSKAAYCFVFGGLMWVFSVSKEKLPIALLSEVLNEAGRVVVRVRDVMEMSGLFSFTQELVKLGRFPQTQKISKR